MGDYTSDCAFAFLPSVGDMVFGLSVYCIDNTIKIGMVTDKVCVKNPEQFMNILNEKFNQFNYHPNQKQQTIEEK